MIALIAAMDRNRVIGANGSIPWHLPNDLRRFKSLTYGHPVIMGRKTFESIGRPLPGRKNIVVTRQPGFVARDCVVANTPDDALEAAGSGDIFVIGGGDLYRQMIDQADRLYLTEVDVAVEGGDAYFPVVAPQLWREVTRMSAPPDERHPYAFTFVDYERR